MGLDVIFFTILAELITIELPVIVHNEGIWYPEPGGNVLVYKGLYIPFSDGRQCFGFSPFRKVIHSDYYVSTLSLSWWREGAKQVETLLGKMPGPSQCLEVGGRGLLHRCMCLALVAPLNRFLRATF